MKALTLWQPWATLVATGHKTIETRGWPTKHRGPLAIHAAAKMPRRPKFGRGRTLPMAEREPGTADRAVHRLGLCQCGHPPIVCLRWGLCTLPLAAVVATVDLVDVVPIHEQFCDCDRPALYVGIGVGGLGREVINVYANPPLAATHGVGVGSIDGGIAIHPGNGNADGHQWVAAQRRRDWNGDEPLYGDYRCGRYAWLLTNVQPLDEPVPAKGRQGLWNWDGDAA